MVDPAIREVIGKYVQVLRTKGIRVDRVILFGSRASGRAHADSDVDLAVISPDFGRDRYGEGKMLLQAAWRIDPRLEPVPISSESYEKDTWLPLIHEVRERGIEIEAA